MAKKMTSDEVMASIKSHLQGCAGWNSDGVQSARTDALNYYLQRPRGDEIAGRSTVVAGDISASVEANLAQMLEAYANDNIIEFDPLDAEDEDSAQLESDATIHFVMKVNNGFMELSAATKDALLQRNGIIKVWCDDHEATITRTFTGVAPEAVEILREQLSKEAKGVAEFVSYSDQTLIVRQKKTQKRFNTGAVAPENFYYLSDEDSFDMQKTIFCCERHITSRSKLLEMGISKSIVDKLKAYAGGPASRPDAGARDPGGMVAAITVNPDASSDRIEWFEGYALMDHDGDGIAERRQVLFSHVEGLELRNIPTSLVPYAIGTTLLMPHRITGISQYDKLRQTQDEHTGLKRSLYDNVNTVTKNRMAYLDGPVNVDDVGDGRSNGSIRVSTLTGITDVRQALMPFQVPDNSQGILANIEALKRERTELGGAALELASGNLQIGGERMGSQGLDRAYSVMEQLASLMTKTLASTLIRNLFLLAHATLRENFTTPVPIKRHGKWLSPIPAQWPERNRVTVKIGMSPNERARQVAALDKVISNQVQLAQLGMDEVLVNVGGFYRTLMDRDRISNIQNPEQYYVDPESEGAQKALQSKAEAAGAEQKKRENLMTQAVGIEQVKATIEKYKADQETQFKYWAETLRAEIEEAKLAGEATIKMLIGGGKGEDGGQANAGEAAEGKPAADTDSKSAD